MKKDFHKPLIVPLKAFHKENFVYILPLSIDAVDLEQFYEHEES